MRRGRKKLLVLLIFLTVIGAVTIWGVSYWWSPERRVERLLKEVRDMEAGAFQGGGTPGQPRSPLRSILPKKDQRPLDDIVDDLAEIGPPAVAPLIEALKDESELVRIVAAFSLWEIGDKRVIALLIDLLEDESETVRRIAAVLLGKIGSQRAINPLIDTLKDNSVVVRIGAIEALVEVSLEQAIPVLTTFLKEHRAEHFITDRRITILAVEKVSDKRVVEILLVGLGDTDEWIRSKSAEVLGNTGAPGVLVPLVAALKDVDRDVRARAAEALGKIGDERAIKPLIIALADEHGNVHDNAAIALAAIGGPGTVEPLIGILKDENEYESSGQDILVKVAETLGQIGDARAVEPLIALLPSPDMPIIVRGRRRSSRPPGPPGYHKRYDGSPVHKSAIIALGRIGDQRAVNVLRALLKDEYPGIRRAVVEALKKIDKKAGDAHE